jgi:hypothetical protein
MKNYTHHAVVRASAHSLLGIGQTRIEAIEDASQYMTKSDTAMLEAGEEMDELRVVAITDTEAEALENESDAAKCFAAVFARAHGF